MTLRIEKTNNKQALKRISELFTSILDNPKKGIGKPEPLKYKLSGYWSRRIDLGNRMVYRIDGEIIWVVSLKGHYK
jgi:toxin YoeB